MSVRWIAIALAIFGSGFGATSAWYWWRSSQESVRLQRFPSIIAGSGSPVVTERQLAEYLQRIGALNAKAAICGAVGVFLATIGSVVATVCQ
jgi:hypothetical protein